MRALIRRVTKKVAPCSRCGVPIPIGEGRVWKCWDPKTCAAPEHCRKGWHASCLDETTCRKRAVARLTKTAPKAEQGDLFGEGNDER